MLKFCHHMRNDLPFTPSLSLGSSRDMYYLFKKLIVADNRVTACEKTVCAFCGCTNSADAASSGRRASAAEMKSLHLALS